MYYLKLVVQFFLKVFPKEMRFAVNERLSRFFKKQKGSGLKQKRIENAIAHFSKIKQMGDLKIEDKTILKFGTGWHCMDIILLYLLGAKKIYTVDHHLHTSFDSFKITFDFIIASDIQQHYNLEALVSKNIFEERVSILDEKINNCEGSILDLFKELNIHFIKRDSCRLISTDLEDRIDLFYSESTLQRIPWNELRSSVEIIINKMNNRGVLFHKIDLKDINAINRISTKSWELGYLKYSDAVFNFLTSSLNYQNRMRESDFLKLFEQNGLKRLSVESLLRDEDVKKLKEFRVAKRFRAYKLNDLATISSITIHQKLNKVI